MRWDGAQYMAISGNPDMAHISPYRQYLYMLCREAAHLRVAPRRRRRRPKRYARFVRKNTKMSLLDNLVHAQIIYGSQKVRILSAACRRNVMTVH